MRLWFSYGSEHSANLVMIGHFESAPDAAKALEAIEAIKAQVYRDGKFACETPCPVSAETGETLNIELKREGYETLSETFSVTAQTKTKTFVMQPVESTDH